MRAFLKRQRVRTPLDRKRAVIQLAAIGIVFPRGVEVYEAAPHVEPTRLEVFSLIVVEFVVVGRNEQVNFHHAIVEQLPGISPEIGFFAPFEIFRRHVAFEKQRTATSIVVQFIDDTAAMRASQFAVRQKYFAERESAVRVAFGVRVRAFFVGASVDAFDAAKQHVHARGEQNGVFFIASERRDCQQNSDCLQRVLRLQCRKDRRREFFQ